MIIMNTKNFLFRILAFSIVFSGLLVPAYSQVAGENIGNSQEAYNPKPASASLYNLGLKSYESGDLNSAISFFKRAIDLDADFVDAYFNLGAIYKKQKDFPLATYAFQKVVELNPGDYEANYELASCHLSVRNYAFAHKYFSVIPPSFHKYSEAQANIAKIQNIHAVATGNPVITGDVSSPENQAKLLVNTLAEGGVQDKAIGYNQEEQLTSKDKSELLVTTLTKPFKNSFDEGQKQFNVLSSDFMGPTGIAKDAKGNIYIANFSVDSIEKIYPDGTKEVFLDKVGIQGPVGLVFDDENNLYVANYRGGSVVKITPDKDVSVVLDDLNKPYYLLYDNETNKLLVTEQGKNSLIELDLGNVTNRPLTQK
ncbi:MAG: tetratricopeptide repeat protein [Candidatus Melainabacteria bacterium]|nr:tetratricopeptide repeat protein [Candidatus Melainabacteria bacterium]